MPHKTKVSKYIKLLFIVVLTATIAQKTNAQVKIDGVSVVVGKNIVLDSDISKFKQEVEKNTEGRIKISDCEMLEQLMMQKLLSHHAVVDSVTVTDQQVNQQVDRNIAYFQQQWGSEEKMIAEYGFNDLEDFRTELFTIEKENLLIQKEQQNLTEKIDVTPEEVRLYFNGLKDKGELPEFQAEIEMAQIVLYTKPTEEENKRIIDKLNELKKEIEEGSSFRLKAIINSDDPGVTQNGGKYTITKDAALIKEFKETAFSLDINEVSDPFKSDFGYHLMQLHEVKGNTRIASHILMQPKIEDETLKETKTKVEAIIQEIKDGKITFEEAVKKYSEDRETKNNNGLLIYGPTGETTFDLTRMDPALYARVNDLKMGEMTPAFYDQTREGEKMFKFLIIKDKTDTHIADLVQDYEKIQSLALQKKKEESITKWAKDKIKETYIKLSEENSKCTFDKNWKKEISK